jgi:hypothetical protein
MIPHQFQFLSSSGGPRSESEKFIAGKEIAEAQAILTGFQANFDQDDHHFGMLVAQLDTQRLDDLTIEVKATLALRDSNWDDRFSGTIDCVVLMETI